MASKAKTADFLTDAIASTAPVLIKNHGVKTKAGKEWKLFARPLSAKAMKGLTESCLLPGKRVTDDNALDDEKLALAMVAASVVDAKGVRVIAIGKEAELATLPNRTYAALQRAALEVNGMMGDASGN